ncbi:MAG: hypothetical protein WD939_10580 [Dehalococcoidia bacterium]
MSNDLAFAHCARLLLDWLNARWETSFELQPDGDAFLASDGEHRIGLSIATLWEDDTTWDERRRSMAERLSNDAGGSYLLWVPPRGDVPADEPGATGFVQRVQQAATTLEPGERTEVLFPVTVKMGKTREEGGYASVVGGLSRWWTRITENVNGTFHVDSSRLHRITLDGEAREQLWDTIGRLSRGMEVGQAADFEVEEAWTLQRLSAGEPGFALAGAPPSIDPTEGILVRRAVRKRLAAANEALDALDVELRAVGLIGSYEYGELETAGATVKALDPSLFSRLAVVCILADGEVRPTFLPRALPWAE